MSAFQQLINLGYRDELPVHLRRKVVPTNAIALILIFAVSVPFSIISFFYFPALSIIPSLGVAICVVVMFINYHGGIQVARIIISVLPILLAASYNAFLCDGSDEPVSSVFLVEMCFALVPFVLFSVDEKMLVVASLFNALVIISFPITKDWVQISADASVLRQGWLSNLTITLAVICGFGCVLGLGFLNKQAEAETEGLLHESERKNQTLEEAQGKLEENMAELHEAKRQDEQRNWTTEGVGRVAELLRLNGQSEQVYDRALAEVVRYLGANQGGLYTVDRTPSQPDTIRLAACYAYDRKKYLNQTCQPGEGLLGQCYLEKEVLYLTDVPTSYVRITSGLGEASPTCLLLMPLVLNGTVEGIVELAFFRPLEEHERAFVVRVGETLAAFIQSYRVNARTQQLLGESQQQAEEMRAQEEEMRQNMEELAATQEEMHRKEQAYLARIADLSQQQAQYEMVNE